MCHSEKLQGFAIAGDDKNQFDRCRISNATRQLRQDNAIQFCSMFSSESRRKALILLLSSQLTASARSALSVVIGISNMRRGHEDGANHTPGRLVRASTEDCVFGC